MAASAPKPDPNPEAWLAARKFVEFGNDGYTDLLKDQITQGTLLVWHMVGILEDDTVWRDDTPEDYRKKLVKWLVPEIDRHKDLTLDVALKAWATPRMYGKDDFVGWVGPHGTVDKLFRKLPDNAARVRMIDEYLKNGSSGHNAKAAQTLFLLLEETFPQGTGAWIHVQSACGSIKALDFYIAVGNDYLVPLEVLRSCIRGVKGALGITN